MDRLDKGLADVDRGRSRAVLGGVPQTERTWLSRSGPLRKTWSTILSETPWVIVALSAALAATLAITAVGCYVAARVRIDIGHGSLVFRTIERVVIVLPCLWIVGFGLAALVLATKGAPTTRRAVLSASVISLASAAMYLLALHGKFLTPNPYVIQLRNDWLVLGWRSLIFGPEIALALGLLVFPPGDDLLQSRRWILGSLLLGTLLVFWSVPIAHHLANLGHLQRVNVLRLTSAALTSGEVLLLIFVLSATVAAIRRIRRGRVSGGRTSMAWYRYGYAIALVALAPYAYDWFKPGPVVSVSTVTIQVLCALAPAALLIPVLAIALRWSWPAHKTTQIWRSAALVSIVTVLHVMIDVAIDWHVMGTSKKAGVPELAARSLLVPTIAAFLVCLVGDTVLRDSIWRTVAWVTSSDRWWRRVLGYGPDPVER